MMVYNPVQLIKADIILHLKLRTVHYLLETDIIVATQKTPWRTKEENKVPSSGPIDL